MGDYRVRILRLDPVLLARALHLPESSRIVNAFTDQGVALGPVLLEIEDETFQPVPEGSIIPRVDAQFEMQPGIPKFIRYA